jgi:two-component system nitrogen regulation response regulator NtrX
VPLHEARDRFEREYILRALAAQNGNISRTADVLGVERSNLYRKMRAFGIAPARREEEPVCLGWSSAPRHDCRSLFSRICASALKSAICR